MDLNRYLDLYLSESQDHLGLLSRALLELEQGGGPGAIEEAFRAAHTVKGMSATMGFANVSQIAHDLESLLDEIRTGARSIDAGLMDDLLARADHLERAVVASASGETPVGVGAEATPRAVTEGAVLDDAAKLAGHKYARVRLKADTQMKVARALILTRVLVQKSLVTRSEPEQFAEDFGGTFALVLAPGADESAVSAVLAATPEIESFSIEQGQAVIAEAPKAAAAAETKQAAKTSFLRVDQRRMDEVAEVLGEVAILQGRIAQLAGAETGPMHDLSNRMTRLISELQHTVLAMRMVPVGDVFDRFPRMVRDAARALGKEIDFQIEGREIEIDRSILEEIADPLVHLLRNAVDHGIESPADRYSAGKPEKATLVLRAWRDRSSVRVQVEDDGRGVNARKVLAKARAKGLTVPETDDVTSEELLKVLAHPGFSTAEQVTDVSGRGVGLDAVVARVRALGGALDMQMRPGEGTTFTMRLPITLAVAQALRVRVGGEDYAIPLTHVSEAIELDMVTVEYQDGREVVHLREEVLPLIRLRSVLQPRQAGIEAAAVVAELGERRTALAVDHLVGREQILVKQFDAAVGTLPIFSGVTLLADGRPALVLDPVSVA